MKSMDKLTTGVAYGTSAGSAGYWFLQLLDKPGIWPVDVPDKPLFQD